MLKNFANSSNNAKLLVNKTRTVNWKGVPENALIYLYSQDRAIFFPIFLTLYIVAFFANLFAIKTTITRKHRCIQKTFIISLSLSDIITATAYSVNYLETFSHPLINWTLGEIMCKFIPFLQIFGVTASSIVLVAIAADRYRNVVHVMSKKWNPCWVLCLCGVFTIWIASVGIAFPMYNFFVIQTIYVVYESKERKYEKLQLCVSELKNEMRIYYICVTFIIFVPIIVIFLWLYYKVANLIWKHRKPITYQNHRNNNNDSNGNETSITQIKSNEEISKITKSTSSIIPMKKSIHVERKIRTFKIILCLMFVFIGCRLPYFIFNVDKLTNVHKEHEYWIMVYIFNGLALLNCALNPFLYTFLYPTLHLIKKVHKAINEFMCQICCCWFTNSEFDEFGKENPFDVENHDRKSFADMPKKNSNVKIDEDFQKH